MVRVCVNSRLPQASVSIHGFFVMQRCPLFSELSYFFYYNNTIMLMYGKVVAIHKLHLSQMRPSAAGGRRCSLVSSV